MAAGKRRIRSVNFRLSEDEYEHLRKVCAASGARSLSDLARSAVNKLVDQNVWSSDRFLEGVVRRLDLQVAELSRQLQRLAQLVEGDTGAAGPSSNEDAG